MYDITIVGSTSLDTFLEISDVSYRYIGDSRESYYCLPVGAKVPIKHLEEHLGGNAANTAVGFSRLKLKTAIITSLCSCKICYSAIKQFKKEKITTKFININKNGCSNLSYILDWHKKKEDRVILSYHKNKDFKKIKWPKTKWIYLTSISKYFKKITSNLPKKPKIAYTPGSWEIRHDLTYLLPLLHKTEVLILNKQEAANLIGVSYKTKRISFLLNNLLKTGAKTVVITDGKNGAYAKSLEENSELFEKALKIKAKEVTGAGDAFSAGFLSAYIKKLSIKESLRWGILNSSFCIQKIGAQNGLLTYKQIKQKYKEIYKDA